MKIVCECLDCLKEFEVEKPKDGETVSCPYCGSGDVAYNEENDNG